MTVLWALIDPIAPGSASMFLLIVTLYWLAFGLLAFTMARRSVWLAIVLLVLALSPPAFVFHGIIWRDVLFANAWLLAAALALRGRRSRCASCACRRKRSHSACSRSAFCCGRMRSSPRQFSPPTSCGRRSFRWKRAAIVFVPIGIALFALVQVVYYGVLGATRQHPLHSIMVFDLGGISHFAKENQFPVTWTAPETALLTTGCYQPTQWDIYWTARAVRIRDAQARTATRFSARRP